MEANPDQEQSNTAAPEESTLAASSAPMTAQEKAALRRQRILGKSKSRLAYASGRDVNLEDDQGPPQTQEQMSQSMTEPSDPTNEAPQTAPGENASAFQNGRPMTGTHDRGHPSAPNARSRGPDHCLSHLSDSLASTGDALHLIQEILNEENGNRVSREHDADLDDSRMVLSPGAALDEQELREYQEFLEYIRTGRAPGGAGRSILGALPDQLRLDTPLFLPSGPSSSVASRGIPLDPSNGRSTNPPTPIRRSPLVSDTTRLVIIIVTALLCVLVSALVHLAIPSPLILFMAQLILNIQEIRMITSTPWSSLLMQIPYLWRRFRRVYQECMLFLFVLFVSIRVASWVVTHEGNL